MEEKQDLPDKKNNNIYMYIYIVYEHELANTNKFIVEKNRIRLVIKDYDIYKLFEVRGRDVYDEIKMLGFNANTEIEYSDIFDFGNIKFPIDNCGIYLSLAIKYPHENIRAFYDFHDGYECWCVYDFKEHNVCIKIEGYFSSYDDTEWSRMFQVFPEEKTITVYN